MRTPALPLLVALGCAAGGPAAPDPTPTPASSPQDPAMTDSLTAVARAIDAAAPAASVAAALGRPSAAPPPDGSRAIFVEPTIAGVRALRIAPLPDGTVHTVRVELAAPIAVATLRERFGTYQVGTPADLGEPWPLWFASAITVDGAALTLLVDVAGSPDRLAQASVTTVTWRVDRAVGP